MGWSEHGDGWQQGRWGLGQPCKNLDKATGVLSVLLGEDEETPCYRWPRKVVGMYQEQEGGKCSESVVGCVFCAHSVPMTCSGRNGYCEDTALSKLRYQAAGVSQRSLCTTGSCQTAAT